jgi:hypothetical protein
MKKICLIGLLTTCLFQSFIKADSWRVLFYMDSSDDLSDMAFKSITEMMQAQINDSVECFIQLHTYYDTGLRYRLKDNGIQFLDRITLTGNSQHDFIDAATWSFNNNTADHTMIIFSNHGWGILDPRWNDSTQKWVIESDITKRSRMLHHQKNHRGFMFNDTSHTYLTNQDLVVSLDHIKNEILQGKNLDILAFDTCMGAMIEIGYQIAPFVDFMVGCQSCALKDGFEYKGIMELMKNKNNSPGNVTIGMVNIFDTYYDKHDDNGIYTNSAFDLHRINEVSAAIDAILASLLNMPNAINILKEAQKDTPRLCMWPMYTDMISFFLICGNYVQDNTDFTNALNYLLEVHAQMIIAYCSGYNVKDAVHGSAIYCPFRHIESSYYNTIFAQSSQWMNMLQLLCQEDALASTAEEWTVG